jgi:hypothetical protein
MKTIRAGRSVTTTATTETDLLNTATAGLGIANCDAWGFAVKNANGSAESTTIKVYAAFGLGAGLVELEDLETVLAAGESVTIERPEGFCGERLRVTSTAGGTGSTTVDCDFIGKELS